MDQGYGFAIGEAMRYNFSSNIVYTAVNIGAGFVVVHIVHSVISSSGDLVTAFMSGVQTLCWEGLASILIPSLASYTICKVVHDQVSTSHSVPAPVRQWSAFAVGVCLIPVYVTFLDPLVTDFVSSLF